MSDSNDDISLSELLSTVRSKKPELAKPIVVTTWDPVRRRWLAVMHLLGASFGMLARAISRQPQSVMKSVNKEVPVAVRSAQRLSVTMPFEALSHYTEAFYKQSGLLMGMSPQDAAKWLQDNHPYTGE